MKNYLSRVKKIFAFTLIELIIVIAIISILVAIVVIIIDPTTLFGGGRNGKRNNDLSTYQSSLSKFLADTPPTGISRSLDSLVGFNSLYSSATSASPYGNCPGLSNGNSSNINGGYLIVDNSGAGNPTNNPNTINFQPLVDNGYLNGVLLNPYGTGTYYACVDTTNNNQLVLYDPTTDNKTTVSKPIINIDPSSTASITSGSGNGGGVSNNSVSYNCPTGSTYSGGGCVNTYTSSVLGTTGSNPYSIVIDSANNIYTANPSSNNVTKITSGGSSSVFASVFSFPIGITIDTSGNLYTINNNSTSITKITPAGTTSTYGSTGANPYGIVTDSSGNAYVSNHDSNNVTKITPGGISTTLGTTGASPYGITIDSSGNIYTANITSNNVTKITPGGVSSILGTTGTSPFGITIDSLRNIYTANYNANNVTKITPGGVSSTFGTTGSYPYGIAVDSSGNIYTSNYTSNNVSMITPAGVSSIIGATVGSPRGIALDSFGNVYITNSFTYNSVTKLTANPNAVIIISPSVIKQNNQYTLGLNNVISSGARVSTGTCSLQVTDTVSTTVLQTLSGNMNNGACKPVAFNAVTSTHPLSILATISATAQTFTYTTTPQ